MPIIKIKNPNYVDGGGEEKWIDAAIYTNQSNEGVEEAPNNGKDYVRRDSDWVISQKIYDELGITKQRFESLLNNAYIIPTLGAVPDETTLVYVDGEYNVNFKIGDYCRVRNTDSEYGYDFFRLYDIKDGLAVWSASETEGSGSAGGETVLISLISNQSASDNALLGASIQVYDVTADQALSGTTWQGSEIIVNVPKEHTYTVNVGAVTGYKTPATKTLDAVNGATRILNMQYDCTMLTINFSSNHNANVSSAKATVSYGSTSTTVTNGQSIKVPYDSQVSISGNTKIQYYKTPETTTFTAGSTTKEVTLEYITSYLIVNYTKNQSVGGTPSISVVTEGQTRSYSANMICTPGEQVTINFGDITYYKTPAAITFTKGVGTETKQGDYLSEKVVVTLNTDNSKVVTNQVITLTCSSNSSYHKAYTCTSTSTAGDSGFVQYIPYGYSYSITANTYYSYTISSISYTAGIATRNATLTYITTNYSVSITLGSSNLCKVVLDGVAYTKSVNRTVPANCTLSINKTNSNLAWACKYNSSTTLPSDIYHNNTNWTDINMNVTSDIQMVIQSEKLGSESDITKISDYQLQIGSYTIMYTGYEIYDSTLVTTWVNNQIGQGIDGNADELCHRFQSAFSIDQGPLITNLRNKGYTIPNTGGYMINIAKYAKYIHNTMNSLPWVWNYYYRGFTATSYTSHYDIAENTQYKEGIGVFDNDDGSKVYYIRGTAFDSQEAVRIAINHDETNYTSKRYAITGSLTSPILLYK